MKSRAYGGLGLAFALSGALLFASGCSEDEPADATEGTKSAGPDAGDSTANDSTADAAITDTTDTPDPSDVSDAGATGDDAGDSGGGGDPGDGLALGTVEWTIDGTPYVDTKVGSNFRWNGDVLIAEFTAGLSLKPQNRLSVSLMDTKAKDTITARTGPCQGSYSYTIMTAGKPISHTSDAACTFTLDETIDATSKEMRGSFVDDTHGISGRFRVWLGTLAPKS